MLWIPIICMVVVCYSRWRVFTCSSALSVLSLCTSFVIIHTFAVSATLYMKHGYALDERKTADICGLCDKFSTIFVKQWACNLVSVRLVLWKLELTIKVVTAVSTKEQSKRIFSIILVRTLVIFFFFCKISRTYCWVHSGHNWSCISNLLLLVWVLRAIIGQPRISVFIHRECSRDKPPFSFVRGQDSTMWHIVWVSPQRHRSESVSRRFLL